jgi:hypothetical protein
LEWSYGTKEFESDVGASRDFLCDAQVYFLGKNMALFWEKQGHSTG